MSIIYKHLIELILKEGDKTEKEIYNEAIKRFEFPKDCLYNIKTQLMVEEKDNFIKKIGDKYYLLKTDNNPLTGKKRFLRYLNEASEEYFKERPHLKKLKKALEEIQ